MSIRRCAVVLACWMATSVGVSAQSYRDVYISLPNYLLLHDKPQIEKGDKPQKYSQQGSYTWTGGRVETIIVTLARDPAFEEKYSPDALKKEANPPKELKINDNRALLWKSADLKQPNGVSHRLVILLAPDKTILIEQRGFGASLEEVAKQFDFAKVEKVLAKPPSKDK